MNLYVKMAICVLLCVGLGMLSGFNTSSEINGWYSQVQKPSWNPPNWLFSPVWITLYILMGISAALVWHSNHFNKRKALTYFIIQFILNLAWSFIFFKLHEIGWAFAEIFVLLIMIVMTMAAFYKVRPLAAHLLIPYFLWVLFATCLNGAIWSLN